MRAHERNAESFRDLLSAALEDAKLVLRALFTINGGSAIALLAFAGANVGNSSGQAMPLAELLGPARFFAYGVGLAVAASMLAYGTNYAYAAAVVSRTSQWSHPYVIDTKASRWWYWIGFGFHTTAVLTAFASLGAFVWGVERIVPAAT